MEVLALLAIAAALLLPIHLLRFVCVPRQLWLVPTTVKYNGLTWLDLLQMECEENKY